MQESVLPGQALHRRGSSLFNRIHTGDPVGLMPYTGTAAASMEMLGFHHEQTSARLRHLDKLRVLHAGWRTARAGSAQARQLP